MSWEPYFPFDKGEDLSIDGPWSYDGRGEVVENAGNILELKIALPALNLLFKKIPAMEVRLRIDADHDGPGNQARADVNGVVTEDDNVTIRSTEAAGRRTIDFSAPVQGQHLGLV